MKISRTVNVEVEISPEQVLECLGEGDRRLLARALVVVSGRVRQGGVYDEGDWLFLAQMAEHVAHRLAPPPAPVALERREMDLADRGDKIQAIRSLRERVPGLGLKDAKDAVFAYLGLP